MLDANQRDILANNVQSAQLAALHRALDASWWKGYEAGKQAGSTPEEGKLYDCPRCMGTGQLESDDSTDDSWWDCSTCDGTGKLADRRRSLTIDS